MLLLMRTFTNIPSNPEIFFFLKQAGGARAPKELRVRGYQLVKYEQRVLEFNEPGEYVCNT